MQACTKYIVYSKHFLNSLKIHNIKKKEEINIKIKEKKKAKQQNSGDATKMRKTFLHEKRRKLKANNLKRTYIHMRVTQSCGNSPTNTNGGQENRYNNNSNCNKRTKGKYSKAKCNNKQKHDKKQRMY